VARGTECLDYFLAAAIASLRVGLLQGKQQRSSKQSNQIQLKPFPETGQSGPGMHIGFSGHTLPSNVWYLKV
jgi:hypothetical protein